MNESLGKAATLGFALLFVLLLVGAGFIYRSTRRLIDNDQHVAHIRDVRASFAAVLATATEAETGQRGYLLTGKADYLQPYRQALGLIDRHLDRLRGLLADDPELRPRLAELERHVRRRLDQLRRNIALQDQQGPDAVRQIILGGEGRHEMRSLRSLVDDVEAEQQRRLDRSATQLQDSAAETVGTGLVTAGVALVLVLAVFYLSRRNDRDRQRAARRLQAQAEQFRVTLASIGDAVVVTDSKNCVTFLNPVAEALTGWTQDEARGRALAEVFHIAAEGDGPARHTVLVGRGGARPVEQVAAPIRAGGGPVLGEVVVFRDVTERRRAVQALREADRLKDEFSAMLAHELRNPLAPLRHAAAVLRLQGGDDPQTAWSRDVIERQVEYLARLVDDLLDVSRIARGKLQLLRGPVELSAVVERAVEAARPLLDARRHRLEVRAPAEGVWVEGDATRLAQVLVNLLNNAAKYTPEGGRVEVALEKAADEAVLRVRDTGVGIPAEMLPKVFDLFMQVERSLDRAEGGLGIGLTLVRRLVALHGGTAEAHSEGSGRGSEFVVRLPLLKEPPAAVTAAAAWAGPVSPHGPTPALRILVVDDNADAADSLVVLLGMMGYEARKATDGPAALAAAEAFHPDVILLDIGLPGMNGYEVARRLKAAPWFGQTVLVAMTGYGSAGDRRRSEETGFARHLVKPVDVPTLQALLASLARAEQL